VRASMLLKSRTSTIGGSPPGRRTMRGSTMAGIASQAIGLPVSPRPADKNVGKRFRKQRPQDSTPAQDSTTDTTVAGPGAPPGMLTDEEENDDRDQIAPAQAQSPSAASKSPTELGKVSKHAHKKGRKASGVPEGVSREGHRVTTSKGGPVPASPGRSTSKDRSPSKESPKGQRQGSKKSPRGGAGGSRRQSHEHETLDSSPRTDSKLQMMESNHEAPGLCGDDSNSGGLDSELPSMNNSTELAPLDNHNDSDIFAVLKPHQDIDTAPPPRGLGSSDSHDRLGSNHSISSRPRSDSGSAELDGQAVDEDGIDITDA